MILRMIAMWLVFTWTAFIITYVLSKEEKLLANLWSKRFALCGVGSALLIVGIVILERF